MDKRRIPKEKMALPIKESLTEIPFPMYNGID